MTRPVRVQAAENTFSFYHLPYSRHDRSGRFSFDQLGIIDLSGRIVEDHDQVVPPVVTEPLVTRPVDVQHHPLYRLSLTLLAMLFSRPLLRDQPRSLKKVLHPCVAHLDRVLLVQLLNEVLYVEIEILLAVQGCHLFNDRHRRPPRALSSETAIDYPVEPDLLVLLSNPPQVPRAVPQYLGRLDPTNLLRVRSQDDLLSFHRFLHRDLRVHSHSSSPELLSRYPRPPKADI